MRCPECKSKALIVVDSRPKTDTIYRRRECCDCGFRFSTNEIGEEEYRELQNIRSYILRYSKKKG